ncbi:MAG: phospholipid carrier-dependent glycosyltransferase [Clostridia bacterium]|nr:phospholipid carrier-dependent glycosyltransferase [Clostridia bacterium]
MKTCSKRAKAVILLLLIAVAATAVFSGCSSKNVESVIVNGDFEASATGAAGWSISDYQNDFLNNGAASDVYIGDGKDGKCIVIENKEKNDTRIYQSVDVMPKTTYKISADIKTENVDPDGAGAMISAIGVTERSDGVYGTTDWQTVTIYTKTDKKQKVIELSFGLGGYSADASGKAMFDNISIEKVSSAPAGARVLSLFKTDSSGSSSSSKEEKDTTTKEKLFKLLFFVLLVGLIVLIIVLGIKTDEKERKGKLGKDAARKLDGKDLIIIAVLTVICATTSFFRLGDTGTANNYWKSSSAGEYVVVEFDNVTNVCGMSHLSNIPAHGEYDVYYEEEDGSGVFKYAFAIDSATTAETADKKKAGSFFEWEISNKINFNTRRIRVESRRTGWALNEIGFLTKDENQQYRLIPCKVIDESYVEGVTDGKPSNLFDEQQYVATSVTYMNSTYFDEIYHARTAYEMIKGWNIYETTHPPFGKILIGLGIRIFGMNPFGWRFMGTLFGVLMVPLIYLFASKIFKKRMFAVLASGLMTFEFMRLAHSRIATIDSFSTFFIILMYYFMYDYFTIKCYDPKDVKARIPLALCGITFGIGAATKWTCLYAGAGLALLFFAAQLFEAVDVKNGMGPAKMDVKKWFLVRFLPTCALCVVFFVAIPVAIYTLTYLPYMPTHPNESLWTVMINNQKSMFSYHSNLDATHPFSSEWWSWPLDIRPIWMYSGDAAVGKKSTIASFGNPAIWLLSIPALIGTVFYACKKSCKKMLVVIAAFALEFLPWILVTRCVFIYHFMPSVPFVILMIVYCFENLTEDKIFPKWVTWVYLGVTAVLFAVFYPALTGLEVNAKYIEGLRWFSTWYF